MNARKSDTGAGAAGGVHRRGDGDMGGDAVSRRTVLRGLTAAGAATTVGVGGLANQTGDAEALAPAIPAGAWAATKAAGAIGGSAAVGWALREFEVLGSDAPPEGLTPEALHQQIYDAALKRRSNNLSTFLDNANIVEAAEHAAYADGKIAAIEELNEQSSQSEVAEAGEYAVDEYFTTLMENILKSWNETVREAQQWKDTVEEHDDLSWYDDLSSDWSSIYLDEDQYELPDGSMIDVHVVEQDISSGTREGHPFYDSGGSAGPRIPINSPPEHDGETVFLADLDDRSDDELGENEDPEHWYHIADILENTYDDVRDGIILWVDEIYDEVQSGELDVEDLVTPRERAEMMTEDEDFPQAVADLIALNMPVDVEREATVHIPAHDATLRGTFAMTSDEQTLETGTLYNPDEDIDGNVYFTYDIAEGEGVWTDFEEGVDGGVATFTDEPYPDTLFRIETTHGETVEVRRDDFEETEGAWEVDLSEQLETAITEIDSVSYFADVDGTEYDTVQIGEPFEIERFEDSDGEEYDSADFERSTEPQEDDNFITQEEWDEMQERNQELIEQYEDAQGGGGFFGDIGLDADTGPIALVAAVVVGYLFVSSSDNQ